MKRSSDARRADEGTAERGSVAIQIAGDALPPIEGRAARRAASFGEPIARLEARRAELAVLVQDLVTVLDNPSGTLSSGKYPEGNKAKAIGTALRKVADELEA